MNAPIKIIIVDPYEIVRDSIKLVFEDTPELSFIGESSFARDMLWLCGHANPDVVLFDFASKGHDVWLIRHLRALHPQIKVLVLTANTDMECAKNAIRAGANGFLYKGIDSDTLKQAIVSVFNNKSIFDEDIEKILPAYTLQ